MTSPFGGILSQMIYNRIFWHVFYRYSIFSIQLSAMWQRLQEEWLDEKTLEVGMQSNCQMEMHYLQQDVQAQVQHDDSFETAWYTGSHRLVHYLREISVIRESWNVCVDIWLTVGKFLSNKEAKLFKFLIW